MAELIDKGALLADFNNTGIHIEFDLPVEEILGEDVDIDDFTMLVQDAIQAYRKMVIGTIQKQPTTTESEIRAKAVSDYLQFVYDNASNEKYDNADGWAFSDLMDLEYKFVEQLKEE